MPFNSVPGQAHYSLFQKDGTELFDEVVDLTADYRNSGIVLNAFGLAFGSAPEARLQAGQVFIDDLEYTSIPEPSTIALAVVSLIGAGLCGWRRRR